MSGVPAHHHEGVRPYLVSMDLSVGQRGQQGAALTPQDNYVSGIQVSYLIEGLDLIGTLVESGNTSVPPGITDWEDGADSPSRLDGPAHSL
jgi:hypothetical protein